jgi:hypothetical protein
LSSRDSFGGCFPSAHRLPRKGEHIVNRYGCSNGAAEMVDSMEDHFGNFSSNGGGLEDPLSQTASNDYAVGRLVEAIRNSPNWKDTATFAVEDDAQNHPGHMDAHRSTVFVISPYTKWRGRSHHV